MTHRRDIDGLRAVAIVPVLLFHAGIRWVSGGYVGVDVFFVISGFLISNLLLDDIEKDRFSIKNFYERRARRILPALFTVLVFTCVAGYAFLLPEDFKGLGESVVATSLFSSNILFSLQTGYFDTPAESRPLLHTWSLAVEEQFYIVYPLFLFLVSRYFRKRYACALLSVLALSFVYSLWAVTHHRSTAFYSAPARAWELLLGGLLALRVISAPRNRLASNAAALVALVLLGYSFLHFSASTAFPGANALYPTLGTALLIYSGEGEKSIVAKLLSARPVAFVGLISYSLYLWHWVLLFFARYYLGRSLATGEVTVVLALSVMVAVLSWYFIENPFRGRRPFLRSQKLLFAGAAVVSLIFVCFGGLLYVRHGLPTRFNQHVLNLLASKEDHWARRDACKSRMCRVGDRSAPPTFLLWGDSHAGAIAPVFDTIARADQISGLIAFSPECAPLLGLRRYDFDDSEECAHFNELVLERIIADHISTIFLHCRWALYAEGNRYGQEVGRPALLTADLTPEQDYREFQGLLEKTVKQLQSYHVSVVIIASVPEVGLDVPTTLVHSAVEHRTAAEIPYSDFLKRQTRTLRLFSQLSETAQVRIIYPHEWLCGRSSCAIIDGNDALYIDSHHLSIHGALHLKPAIEPLLIHSN